jgi:RNA polymerase sigma-70 factor (ECF subfamily)
VKVEGRVLTTSDRQDHEAEEGSMQSDDRQLVQRSLEGDHGAFDRLYDRHAPRVFHLLRRLTGSDADAEDLTQETFLAAYRDLLQWHGRGAFGTWLCGIAFHQYTGLRRRVAPETELLEDDPRLSVPEADPLAHCLREERKQRIESAIVGLPPLFREAFVLVKVEGLTYRQAAAFLGQPMGTVQWRLWRAVCLLQAALAERSETAMGPAPRPERAPKRAGPEERRACQTSPPLEQ